MQDYQKIHIQGIEYYIVDSIQNLRAEDSFIHRNNKLAMFNGAGEARKYVGSYIGTSGERLSSFFEYDNWGKTIVNGKRTYPIIQQNCFFNKENLQQYLFDAKVEYQKQEQLYHNDIAQYYDKYVQSINDLPSENISFSIYDVSDHLENAKGYHRGYIRSDDDIWAIWRKIVLPKISYLSILKLVPVNATEDSLAPLFYFRIFLDYQFRSIVHPQLLSEDQLFELEPEQIVEQEIIKRVGRKGQQKYRKEVINHMPQCPFTLITDEILLRASHIKPYMACINENNETEALDYLNGLALTPTYDWLFDQGYITFLDDGRLICGTRLSRYTWEKLSINPNAKNKLRIYPEGRETYLAYHRTFVFQDNIDDFL